MTCIVGYLDKETNSVWIGSDSFGSTQFSGEVYNNKKVFHLEDYPGCIVGYTSSFRMGQLLQYSRGLFDELAVLKGQVDEGYMVSEFVTNLQGLFESYGFGGTMANNQKSGGTFLIGVEEKLFIVQDDYSVLEPKDGYLSVGSGKYHAMGSLHTTRDMELSIPEKMLKALEAAERSQLNVKRPFYLVNNKSQGLITVEESGEVILEGFNEDEIEKLIDDKFILLENEIKDCPVEEFDVEELEEEKDIEVTIDEIVEYYEVQEDEHQIESVGENKFKTFDEYLDEQLQDPEFARLYEKAMIRHERLLERRPPKKIGKKFRK